MKITYGKLVLIIIGIITIIISSIYLFPSKKIISLETETNEQVIFAHRGLAQYFPENSFSAFNSAKILHLQGVEIDVRMTKDKQFVLFHDDNCMRLLGINSDLEDLNFTEIAEIPIIFEGKKSKDKIMKLENFFAQFGKDFFVYLDVKRDLPISRTSAVDSIIKLIKKYNLNNNVIFASADIFTIFNIEYRYPEVMTAMEGFKYDKIWLYRVIPEFLKPDFISSFAKDFNIEEMDYLKANSLINQRIFYHITEQEITKMGKFGFNKFIYDYDSLKFKSVGK